MSSKTLKALYPHISHTHYSKDWKFWKPHYPTTPYKKLIPALSPDVRVKYYPIKSNSAFLKGYEGRLQLLAGRMTDLIKLERIEISLIQAEELRPYAERVCQRTAMSLN